MCKLYIVLHEGGVIWPNARLCSLEDKVETPPAGRNSVLIVLSNLNLESTVYMEQGETYVRHTSNLRGAVQG
jgi:hypothetical protein